MKLAPAVARHALVLAVRVHSASARIKSRVVRRSEGGYTTRPRRGKAAGDAWEARGRHSPVRCVAVTQRMYPLSPRLACHKRWLRTRWSDQVGGFAFGFA